MPTDLRSEPLGALIEHHPGWREVFDAFGITGREGMDIALAAAADRANVDVEKVLAAMAGPKPPRWTCDDIASAPLGGVISHIEEVHHTRMREQLAELSALLRQEQRDRPDDGRLAAADQAFESFRAEMEAHLETEERVLFPLCRDLVEAFSWPSFHTGPIEGPLDALRHDHDQMTTLLAEVAAICDPGSDTARLAEEVAGDLALHLSEENDLLFPEVLRLADELAG